MAMAYVRLELPLPKFIHDIEIKVLLTNFLLESPNCGFIYKKSAQKSKDFTVFVFSLFFLSVTFFQRDEWMVVMLTNSLALKASE